LQGFLTSIKEEFEGATFYERTPKGYLLMTGHALMINMLNQD
jgi:hypothetical protein